MAKANAAQRKATAHRKAPKPPSVEPCRTCPKCRQETRTIRKSFARNGDWFYRVDTRCTSPACPWSNVRRLKWDVTEKVWRDVIETLRKQLGKQLKTSLRGRSGRTARA